MASEFILVGNSKALYAGNNGGRIDKFASVCRMNGGVPTEQNKHAIGSRTTHWSFSTMSRNVYRQWAKGFPDTIRLCLNGRCNYDYVDGECWFSTVYDDLVADYGKRPSTGLITAYYLRRQGIKLSIIGFDFYESKSWYCPERAKTPHNWTKEREYMQGLGVTIL